MHKQCNCGRYLLENCKEICSICQWDYETKTARKSFNFSTVGTTSFAQNKNVPNWRIDMIKKRAFHPDGRGEVVLKNHAGKLTNRLASEY